jgi:SsuE family FMN reductase
VDAVAEADAIVIATPIYKASYTGILKAFLDLLPQDGLKDKLVLPLATGGSQSHLLALDYALRPVLQALDARQVFTSIYATSQQLTWSDVSGLTLDRPSPGACRPAWMRCRRHCMRCAASRNKYLSPTSQCGWRDKEN